MMELLKRFEEESKEDELKLLSGDTDDDSDEDDGLEGRLANLDLGEWSRWMHSRYMTKPGTDNATYNDLWGSLTQEERDKFLRTLNDPSGDLAKQLLASEDLDDQTVEPWWEAADPQLQKPSLSTPSKAPKRHGHRPNLADIPTSAIKAAEAVGTNGPSLLYNICAVM